jgi:hypothetical protein
MVCDCLCHLDFYLGFHPDFYLGRQMILTHRESDYSRNRIPLILVSHRVFSA